MGYSPPPQAPPVGAVARGPGAVVLALLVPRALRGAAVGRGEARGLVEPHAHGLARGVRAHRLLLAALLEKPGP